MAIETGLDETTIGAAVYLAILIGTGVACAMRATIRPGERGIWALVAIGLLAWATSEAYAALAPERDAVVASGGFAVFYVTALPAILILLWRRPPNWSSLAAAAITLLGLSSVWSFVVFEHVVSHHEPTLEQTQLTAYAGLDILAIAAAVALITRSGWRLGTRDLVLVGGLGLIAAGDSLYLNDAAHGAAAGGEAIGLWTGGAGAIAVAAWMPAAAPLPGAIATVRLSLAIGSAAAVAAVAILLIDHFDPVGPLTFGLTTATMAVAVAQAIRSHIQRNRDESRMQHDAMYAVSALALAVDAKDPYTHNHSERVARYASELGRALGLSARRVDRLEIAGRLHDVGKIAVSDAILLKPDRLTDAELAEVRRHPVEGERLAAGAGLDDVATWIRHHHERWDGRGYPDGLASGAIPLEARILAAADAFDAMISPRSYQPALPVSVAKAEIAASAGSQFDVRVAAMLVEIADGLPMVAPAVDPDGAPAVMRVSAAVGSP